MTETNLHEWTPAELDAFNRLVRLVNSKYQMDRISGRLDMRRFVAEHGQAKCDAMFAELEARGAT